MLIMNLTSEFKEARMFVKNRLSLQPDNGRVNLFECTIRVLGGFISTYYLTGYVEKISLLHLKQVIVNDFSCSVKVTN